MSEKITKQSTSTVIKDYTVHVQYYQRVIKAKGIIEEVLKDEDIAVGMLARTSIEHTRFGTRLMQDGGTTDSEVLTDLAKKFVQLMVVDEKVQADLLNDAMACIDIYLSEPVQQDIERFLSSWGSVRRMINAESHEPTPTNE